MVFNLKLTHRLFSLYFNIFMVAANASTGACTELRYPEFNDFISEVGLFPG